VTCTFVAIEIPRFTTRVNAPQRCECAKHNEFDRPADALASAFGSAERNLYPRVPPPRGYRAGQFIPANVVRIFSAQDRSERLLTQRFKVNSRLASSSRSLASASQSACRHERQ
jgi:hypothetical protein